MKWGFMTGKIVKGIAGFYYVHTDIGEIYECKAKGIFRNRHVKPLVGDDVEIQILSEEEKTGNIDEIKERKNSLIRPAVANVDQALIIFSIAKPAPNFNLLDRFLILMERSQMNTLICFNKCDLVDGTEAEKTADIYRRAGYRVLLTSACKHIGIDGLKQELLHKTTTVAGPSGVGKSSLINLLQSEITMETGKISTKIERGKHTTRHSELIAMGNETFIMDTPGFSSIAIDEITKEELWMYFREFAEYEKECRFQGCAHIKEPDCGVKTALSNGEISRMRYDNYVLLYEELKEKRRY